MQTIIIVFWNIHSKRDHHDPFREVSFTQTTQRAKHWLREFKVLRMHFIFVGIFDTSTCTITSDLHSFLHWDTIYLYFFPLSLEVNYKHQGWMFLQRSEVSVRSSGMCWLSNDKIPWGYRKLLNKINRHENYQT